MNKYNFVDPDLKLLFSKALDQVYFCKKNYSETFLDFLDPVKTQTLLKHLKEDVCIAAFGGFVEAERKMVGFFHTDVGVDKSLFPIKSLSVTYNKKFSRSLGHRDFLGSILALGINRCKVGDIVLLEDGAVIYVSQDIFPYIMANLETVANTKVKVIETELGQSSVGTGREVRAAVSSMRLDACLSAAFHFSRTKSLDLIRGLKVFVNWTPIDNPSKQIAEGDIITLRGTGRVKIIAIAGETRSGRLSLILEVHNG